MGYTQFKVAQLMGISDPTMNNYETGKRIPMQTCLKKKLRDLNATLDGFFAVNREMKNPAHHIFN